jgi:putative ATP-binding cassette transporter
MTAPPPDAGSPAAASSTEAVSRPLGLLRQLATVLAALRASPVGRPLLVLSAVIVVVVGATAYGQIRLNGWNKPFYDALSRRDLREFIHQLGVFCIIAGGLLVLNVGQRWLHETMKLRLREGLVTDLVGRWLQPRRAFWLSGAGPMGVNPDQRMHEDTLKLCELSADLGIGLLQATILLVSFSGILWTISGDFSFRFNGRDYALPGFMLWAALIYAGAGSLLSYLVGRNLIGRNAERYAREADLRFSLVRVNEHLDGISLANGEPDEKRRVDGYLSAVLAATRSLVRGVTRLTWVTAGFGWTTIIAPTLVAAPLYLSGKISFGGLMMAAAAFTQAQTALRWFVDNFSIIAEWRATLLRVASFRVALTSEDTRPRFHSQIAYDECEPGNFRIDGLQVWSPDGSDRLEPDQLLIRSGEHLLILAAPGTHKTLLFRALAGLWPWGTGRVSSPANEPVFYMPRGTPYLPTGTLREVLCYPRPARDFSDTAVLHALYRFGLERLAPLLDQERRWDRELNHDEQMALAFARVLLHAPAWLLIDDGLGALDDQTLARVTDVFGKELAATAVIHIGRAAQAGEPLFSRIARLVSVEPRLQPAGDGSAEPVPANPEAPRS